MKKILLSSLAAAAVAVGSVNAQLVQSFNGNGQTGFGGTIGEAVLEVSNDASGSLNFSLTRGPGDLNDVLVIYIDNGLGGGIASTSGLDDTGDLLRQGISGFSGTDRSILEFNAGFAPNYALALDQNFAGLWELSAGSLPFISGANLSPTGTVSAAEYTFSINVTDFGLTANSGQAFQFVATYLNAGNSFRANEFIGFGFSGANPGLTTVDNVTSATFTTVPEPSTYALLTLGALALGGYAARRRARK
jgi:trimeric autotransporter adhesin